MGAPANVKNRTTRSSSETFRNSPKSPSQSKNKSKTGAPSPSQGLAGTFFKITITMLIMMIVVYQTTKDIELLPDKKGLVPRFVISLGLVFIPTIIGLQHVKTRRTAAAFLFFEIATLMMNISTSVAWYRNPRELGILPDFGHDFFGELPEKYMLGGFEFYSAGICDNLILSLTVLTVVFAALQPNGMDIFRRFVMVYGSLNFMRTFTVLMTSLPDASAKCRELTPIGDLPNGAWTWNSINERSVIQEIIIHTLMITIPVHPVTCGDMVFSGHSNTALCFALVWHTYYKWVPGEINYVKSTVWIMAFGACFGLLLTKVHYTLDIALSIYFSITVWSAYHRLAIDVALGRRFISVFWIDAKILYPLLEWLEAPLEDEEILEWTKERGEMNLFELQMLGVATGYDTEEEKKRRTRSQEVAWSRTPSKLLEEMDSFGEEKKMN